MDDWKESVTAYLDEGLIQAVLSGNKRKTIITDDRMQPAGLCARQQASKVRIRPVRTKEGLLFQAEEFVDVASGTGRKAYHRNMTAEQAADYIEASMAMGFSQCQLRTGTESVTVLRSKKGHVRVARKRLQPAAEESAQPTPLSHNRERNYILKEGTVIPFLVDLGVMTGDGTLIKAKYNKFRQLNRFLEFIRDILPELPKDREITILDFGCGKSYLTFAMYYYLVEMMGCGVRIIGLDLKEDVIARCNQLAEKYGYHKLRFLLGNIADYTGQEQVDMVVTLHACDTATDYALAKAAAWNAKVILSVPCCQHELNGQIQSDVLAPVLSYGLLKERMAALLTDGIRGQLLEQQGYEVQILEFIDMEHTPKNILIRAVKRDKKMLRKNRKDGERLERLISEINGELTLQRLLRADKKEGE